jgi:hypothetical protein
LNTRWIPSSSLLSRYDMIDRYAAASESSNSSAAAALRAVDLLISATTRRWSVGK